MTCFLSFIHQSNGSVLSKSWNHIYRSSISGWSRIPRTHSLRNHFRIFSTSPGKYSLTYQASHSQSTFSKRNKFGDVTAEKSKYVVREQPLGTLSPLRVVIVGGGVSGLDMLYTLQRKTKYVEYIIFEKNPECGGTWYENRYPGCASDDPSHHYQYTHSTNPSWASLFAPAAEIKQYLNDFIDRNNIRGKIKCNHRIINATWNNKESQWNVTVKNEATGQCSEQKSHILVDATGIFNDYKWPKIKGLNNFRGDLIHTANWPSNFNYRNKTVAVLGNGASGVQIVPALQPDVKKLIHVIRSKTWIAPPSKAVRYCSQHTISSSSGQFSKDWKNMVLNDSDEYREFIDEIDRLAREDRFKTILTNTPLANTSKTNITNYMTSQLLTQPHLLPILIPTSKTPIGCRRLTSSETYLPSLCHPNVTVTNSPIKEITASGIVFESGESCEVDAIICATGFNTSFIPRFPLVGADGVNLRERWKAENGGPKAYMGIMVQELPNYFRFLGPNSPLAHGPIPHLSTHISTYILSHITKMQRESYLSIRVQPVAVEEFNEHVRAFMPRTAWAGSGCGGWYRGGEDGEVGSREGGERNVTALHPGSQRHWEEMVGGVRWEDFEFRRGLTFGVGDNRFGYLGNGEVVNDGMEENGLDRMMKEGGDVGDHDYEGGERKCGEAVGK